MRSPIAALAFLTRIPVGRWVVIGAGDVARSAAWFPLVGILLGAIYGAAAVLLHGHLPLAVVGIILVALDAVLTGALHYDGLADTADGFGGGKDRPDVLRIMRDHSIGSYGGVALILLITFKAAVYSALLARERWFEIIIITTTLGRWSMLLLTSTLPYARKNSSVIEGMGAGSLAVGTLTAGCALLACQLWRAWAAAGAVLIVTFCFGVYCRRRIGGVTGDTLGANLQFCESATLLAFLWTGRP